MATRDSYEEGTPSWVDLASPDVEASKKFYADLFGWEYESAGNDDMPYTMAYKNGRPAAGLGPIMDENSPPAWVSYFAVDSADATAEKITDAGGTLLLEPADILTSGRLALAAGPGGEVFGIWEAKDHIGAGVVNEHGSISWTELMTDDVDGALAFYQEVFGHKPQTADMGGGFMYSTLAVGDNQVAGVMAKPDPNMPNFWGTYFAVDDAAASVEAMREAGANVMFGPDKTEGVGVLGGGTDPQGAHFSVITPETPPD